MPSGANARFFEDTFPYNAFRELYGSGDVPAGTTDVAAWVNGKNVTELRASLAEASKAGVDVSFRTPNATGEQLHHIIPAADPDASAVRARLMQLGIHPNSVFNGVGINTDIHRYIHNKSYYDALASQFRNFRSTDEAVTFLDDIARHIDGLPAPSTTEEARRFAEKVTEYIKQYDK